MQTSPHIDLASTIAMRATRIMRLTANIVEELRVDQAEVVAPVSGGRDSHRKPSHVSDPTYAATRLLAPFAKWDREMIAALRSIDRTMDDAERTYQRILSESGRRNRGLEVDAEERCPGYSVERRTRLGGCGNVLEHYRDRNGVSHVRPERLCVTCRKDKNADERPA